MTMEIRNMGIKSFCADDDRTLKDDIHSFKLKNCVIEYSYPRTSITALIGQTTKIESNDGYLILGRMKDKSDAICAYTDVYNPLIRGDKRDLSYSEYAKKYPYLPFERCIVNMYADDYESSFKLDDWKLECEGIAHHFALGLLQYKMTADISSTVRLIRGDKINCMFANEDARTLLFKFLNHGYIFDEQYSSEYKKGKVYGKCEHGHDIFDLEVSFLGVGMPVIKTCCPECEKKSKEELREMCKEDKAEEEK